MLINLNYLLCTSQSIIYFTVTCSLTNIPPFEEYVSFGTPTLNVVVLVKFNIPIIFPPQLCLTAQFNLNVLSAQEHPAQVQGLWVHSCLGLLDLIQVQIHTWIIWALAAVCWFQLFMSE